MGEDLHLSLLVSAQLFDEGFLNNFFLFDFQKDTEYAELLSNNRKREKKLKIKTKTD